jgi:hypothetical protein
VRHEVEGDEIVIEVPGDLHGKVTSDRFSVQMPPNARLAGLVRKVAGGGEGQPVVPLVFAEVKLPAARAGATPRLRTRLPGSHWVFLWDRRRQTGYLLATPRTVERAELRFRVEWPGVRVASPRPAGPGEGGS